MRKILMIIEVDQDEHMLVARSPRSGIQIASARVSDITNASHVLAAHELVESALNALAAEGYERAHD